jgi:hypothetical protein
MGEGSEKPLTIAKKRVNLNFRLTMIVVWDYKLVVVERSSKSYSFIKPEIKEPRIG